MKRLATGEDRHFILSAPNNVTLSGYSAKYEIAGSLGVVKTGIVEKSTDNTKFEVKIDLEGVKPNKYELRIMVTDEIENFTYMAYSEEIVIRVWYEYYTNAHKTFSKNKKIQEVAEILEKYKNFEVNTNQRLAHFLAQVREEVGAELKPISENLNYTEEGLKKTFKVFRDNPQLAEDYGKDEDTPKADPVKIANYAYANKLGNGNPDSDKDGDIDEDDDGYRYRGAGVLQITGKFNFEEVQRRIDRYAPTSNIDIVNSNDIHTLEGAILAGLAFWMWKDIYKAADMGTSDKDVDGVTKIINKYTNSYKERREYFHKIKHLI